MKTPEQVAADFFDEFDVKLKDAMETSSHEPEEKRIEVVAMLMYLLGVKHGIRSTRQ